MRLFPILAAIVVSALVYVFIFQRDTLTGEETADNRHSAGKRPGSGIGGECR